MFSDTIAEHPLLVYTSALPFTPVESLLFKTFSEQVSNIPWIVGGYRKSWPRLVQTLRGNTSLVQRVTFSPDGTRIVTLTIDGTIRVWDATSGTELIPPLRIACVKYCESGHRNDDGTLCIAISRDGRQIASGSAFGIVALWNIDSDLEATPLIIDHEGCVSLVAFSPDGTRIMSHCPDEQTIHIWNTS